MRSYYLVVFDRSAEKRYREFHKQFTAHRQVTHWWHYIKSSYVVGTDMDADELSEHFRSTAVSCGLDPTHLVLKVDLRRRQGWLTDEAWDWLRKNARSS